MSMAMWLFGFGAAFLGVLALGTVVRMIWGPTDADRAVALDTMNSLVIAIMILLSAAYDSVLLIDLAVVYAGLSFVATMFLARYIERRSRS
ncbi:MAG: cation:proton antiporter [Pyramidobacter sp.]|nr:cation:proton antiporter [Pyramidobacter sp.]